MVIRQILTCFILALFCATPAYALTKLEASVDNPQISADGYFILTVIADDKVNNGSLDTSVLAKDFAVGSMNVSRSTQVINGNVTKETRWQILLAPKQKGTVILPSLSVKNIRSAPITMQVVTSGTKQKQQKTIFIKGELSTKEAYVGQLITYKAKLYLSTNLQRGKLEIPSTSGVQISQSGKDTHSIEILNGRRYSVIARTYNIIVDKAGELTLPGARFSGDILVQSQSNNPMFSMMGSQSVQTKAPPVKITIIAIPKDFSGNWLVSSHVEIKENWPVKKTFEVGAPITRDITLVAVDTDKSTLPDLALSLPDSFKSYPEKAQRKNSLYNNQVVAQLKQTIAIVPTKTGSYTLPEIKVPWWNSQLEKLQFATLPARTIKVIASANASEAITPMTEGTNASITSSYWKYLTFFFALLWLATLALWRWAIYRNNNDNDKIGNNKARANADINNQPRKLPSLEKACEQGEVGPILLALQGYFTNLGGHTMTIADIAALTPELRQAIAQLQQHAYGKSSAPLDTKALLQAVKDVPDKQSASAKQALVNLNPT